MAIDLSRYDYIWCINEPMRTFYETIKGDWGIRLSERCDRRSNIELSSRLLFLGRSMGKCVDPQKRGCDKYHCKSVTNFIVFIEFPLYVSGDN